MKNNTMKRVLAATLSVLTVAGTMPVNVGGFLTESSVLVANAEDVVKTVAINYADTGVTSVEYDGMTLPYEVVTNVYAAVGKDITFHSTTKLAFCDVIDASVTATGEKGNYTYTFTVPAITEGVTVSDKTAAVAIVPYQEDGTPHTLNVYEGALEKDKDGKYVTDGAKEITSDSDSKPKQGTKVTVLADTPFNVLTAQGTVASGTWDEKAGQYVLAGYYIEDDVVAFVGTPHVSDFEYTLDKNVLTVTDKAENSNIKNETAAWVKGYYQGEIAADGEGDDDELGEDTTQVGPVELKTGGERVYDKNGGVDVSMQRVDKLLGWGGGGTKDSELFAFKYQITKDGKAIEDVSSEGTVTKEEYENPKTDGTIGTTTFTKDEEKNTINLFKAVDKGHYEVTITVWGTDNTAAAFKLVYTFDIVSEELGPESFDLFFGYSANIAKNDLAENNAFNLDLKKSWDAENKIWLVEVPSYYITEDANKKKYVDLEDQDAYGVTARLKAALAADKYKDLVYGDTENGYQVIAEQAGNDLDTVYTLKVEIYNENYCTTPGKPEEIEIPWKLVEAESEPRLEFYSDFADDDMQIRGEFAKDEESIRARIMRNVANVKHDETKIDFAYLAESDWDTDQDLDSLDTLTPGVPIEDGRYKVFLKYDGKLVRNHTLAEGEVAEGADAYEYCYVKVDRSDYFFDFDDTLQTIIYGDMVALNDYTVMDYLGEPVDVTVDNSKFTFDVYEADWDYDYNHEIYYYPNKRILEDVANPGLLNAYMYDEDYDWTYDYGLYYVEVSGETTDGKEIGGTGYYVRVNKKKVTKDMVGIINRKYDAGKTVYVWNPYTADGQIIAKDTFDYIDTEGNKATKQSEIAMAAVGGTYSAIKPGSYNVQLSIRTAQEKVNEPHTITLDELITSFLGADKSLYNSYVANTKAALGDEKYYNTAMHLLEHEFNHAMTENSAITVEEFKSIKPAKLHQTCYSIYKTYFNELHLDEDSTFADWFAAASEEFEDINVVSNSQKLDDYRNYTIENRKLTTSWNITSSVGNPEFVNFNEGETGATPAYARLFNGGKLHVAFTRPDGSGDTVQSFGVIIDKDGKLAAPANDEDLTAYAAATTALVLDNGYTTSGRTLSAADQAKTTRGANITPTSADTGVWVRPYYVDNDGAAHYGEPKYFTLPEVTQAELQLRVPGWGDTSAVTRKLKDGKSTGDIEDYTGTDYDYMDNELKTYTVGPVEEVKTKKVNNQDVDYLNRRIYYVAAVKNTLDAITDPNDSTNSRTKVTPERFGIILDKNGVVPGAEGEGAEKAYANAAAELKVDDKRFTTTTSSNSNFHGENAYGANITPKDVFTGVWVRPYVDFGNGLIVYAEPVYFNSFNEYFAKEYGVTFDNSITDTKDEPETYNAIGVNEGKTKFEFYYKPVVGMDNYTGKWYNNANRPVDYTAAGVVVDKANSITDFNKLTVAAADGVKVVSGSRTKANINANETHPGVYGANVKKTDGTINVRPFIVIDENLTLYGPVQSVTFADVSKEAVEYWEVPMP